MSIACKVLKLTINAPAVTPFLCTHVQRTRKGKASHLLTVHEARIILELICAFLTGSFFIVVAIVKVLIIVVTLRCNDGDR